jgi:hypothetical protein
MSEETYLSQYIAWGFVMPDDCPPEERRERIRDFLASRADVLEFWPTIEPAELRRTAQYFGDSYKVTVEPEECFADRNMLWLADEIERDRDQFYPIGKN